VRAPGPRVALERQPMDLLILLFERRGQLVTRADIVERLWGPDIFVDVETGVHTAIRKIRRALRDSPDVPTFLDTVPGKGYRFIAPVSVEGPGTAAPVPELALAEVPAREPVPPRSLSSSRALFATIALMLAVLAGLSAWAWHRAELTPSEVTLAVLPFEDLSGDPEAE